MRILKEIVKDFLNTDIARKGCNEEIACDLIAEMDEHIGSYETKQGRKEKWNVQYGAGVEIHPVGDIDGDTVIADINPDGVYTDEEAEIIAQKIVLLWNRDIDNQ